MEVRLLSRTTINMTSGFDVAVREGSYETTHVQVYGGGRGTKNEDMRETFYEESCWQRIDY